MDRDVLDQLRSLINRESGIYLPADKEQLLVNRLQKRLRACGVKDEREYLKIVELDASGEELTRLLDVVSTNVTHFYREERHFSILTDILKDLEKKGQREIKMWSAACSSGEEPYSMAMVARESLDSRRTAVRILATDISERILQRALQRHYVPAQLTKLPPGLVKRYFNAESGAGSDLRSVTDDIASLVTFKRFNLSKFPYSLKGQLDIIFCRNVMIYFTLELRRLIIAEFQRLLRPGGYMFLSHSENLLGISHGFKALSTAVYQKPEGVRG